MIRLARPDDLPDIRTLWDCCFPDDSGFNPYYFDHLFSLHDTLLYEQDGQIAAMVQMLPYTLRVGQETFPVTYIYGACTHPEFRRQHLMSQLLSASFDLDQQRNRIASMLIPQEAWLFDFYRPFGYLPQFSIQTHTEQVIPAASTCLRALTAGDLDVCQALYNAQTASCDMTVVRSAAQWQNQLTLFQTLGAGAYGWEQEGVLAGYAFVWQEESGIWAQECICADSVDQKAFLAALAHQTGHTQVRFSCPADRSGTALGCIKFYTPQPSMHGYMNLMLN